MIRFEELPSAEGDVEKENLRREMKRKEKKEKYINIYIAPKKRRIKKEKKSAAAASASAQYGTIVALFSKHGTS